MKVVNITIKIYVDETEFHEDSFAEDLKEGFEERTGYEALTLNIEIEE